MRHMNLFISVWCKLLIVVAFSYADEDFIRTFSMMKIYESCFGSKVLQQIRAEIKVAALQCISHQAIQPSSQPSRPESSNFPNYGYDSAYSKPLKPSLIAYRPNNYYPYSSSSTLYSGYPNQGPMLYHIPFQQSYGFQPNNLVFLEPQYYGNQRITRNMDASVMRNRTTRTNGSVRNANTFCVMQHLGYLDNNLKPNYEGIVKRLRNMSISQDLRRDIEDGVTFCKKFSKCLPEEKVQNNPLSDTFKLPTFFFTCYNHKKMEACISKDIKENRLSLNENELTGLEMELRNVASANEVDRLSSFIYEFMYYGGNLLNS